VSRPASHPVLVKPLGAARVTRPLAVDFVLAWREIVRRKRRSGVALAAVAFGAMALMLAGGFVQWLFWDMRESTIRSGLGHLQVTRPGYHDAGLADPLAFLLGDADGLAQPAGTLAGVPVQTVAPRITFFGLVSRGDTSLSFQGEGLVPARERPVLEAQVIVEGEPLAEADDVREVVLGQGLAQNLGVRVGERVVLLVNSPGGGVNAAELRVRGLFTTVSKAYDDVSLQLPLRLAQQLLRVQGATRWVVTLPATAGTDAAVATLRERLPAAEYEVTPWYALADFYAKTVALFRRQVAVLDLIIGVIVVLTISNTLTIAVLERTAEIGTGLALGLTPRLVLRGFVVEGLMLGLVGAALGLLLGTAAAFAISAHGIPMPPPPGMARGYVAEIRLSLPLAAQAAAVAVASCLAGALAPAWRASRMTVVDAIRSGR
jgi:putative ABC transport system permease protein